ncbi:hypothetical protein PSN45_003739 [Yamadazyma tenuis]|uniref:uncharacterized protein n=1 Tax=Candida tenuis TaxID=2315449 RepID=UPI0027994CDC|nr:hypothetical protein PSN45_003739 [Yamadazyma tenuis]
MYPQYSPHMGQYISNFAYQPQQYATSMTSKPPGTGIPSYQFSAPASSDSRYSGPAGNDSRNGSVENTPAQIYQFYTLPAGGQAMAPAPRSSTVPKSVNFGVHKLSNNLLVPLELYNVLMQLFQAIRIKKYATSAISPSRNYLTVFEYSINDQWIIWDYETGFVHLTGMWKAAEIATSAHQNSNSHKAKADIVKLLDSTPTEYHDHIKRIRGGFLKIQGTWLPYSMCKILARRFCYYIRFELIPIFGNDFPDYCLPPYDTKFGDLRFDGNDAELQGSRLNFDIFEASKCLQALGQGQTPQQVSAPVAVASEPATVTSAPPPPAPESVSRLPKLDMPFKYDSKKRSSLGSESMSPKSLVSPTSLQSPLQAATAKFQGRHSRVSSLDKPFDHGVSSSSGSSSISYGPQLTPVTPNYIASTTGTSSLSATDPAQLTPKRRISGADGIGSLLAAADITDNKPVKARRISMKINDLLI